MFYIHRYTVTEGKYLCYNLILNTPVIIYALDYFY